VAGKMLADMEAEVVKLEMPPIGDYARLWRTDWSAGFSSGYMYWNRGKQSVCIDLTARSAKIAHELLKHFDVFIENFTPGVLARYGFSWEQLRRSTRLIMCSLSAFGQTGPMANCGNRRGGPGNDG
jgi:crotonobetainyl-CoA:carnitine CoA-transferase CaiB-like acyl-CoA transferase